jgi:predicted transcriptional regulator
MAMTLRTDDELDAALTALAEAEGTSRQEVIRRAVLDRYARTTRRAKIDEILNTELERYADALDRLGQ